MTSIRLKAVLELFSTSINSSMLPPGGETLLPVNVTVQLAEPVPKQQQQLMVLLLELVRGSWATS